MNYPSKTFGIALLLFLFVFSFSSCNTEQKTFKKVVNKGTIIDGKKIRQSFVSDIAYYASCLKHNQCNLGPSDNLHPTVRATLTEQINNEQHVRNILNLESIPDICPPDAWWEWKLLESFLDNAQSKFLTQSIKIYSEGNELIAQSKTPIKLKKSNYQYIKMKTVGTKPDAGDKVRIELSTIDMDTQQPNDFNYIVEVGPL